MPYGAGELGESEYGENAEEMPLVGEGIIGLLRAMATMRLWKTILLLCRCRKLEPGPAPTCAVHQSCIMARIAWDYDESSAILRRRLSFCGEFAAFAEAACLSDGAGLRVRIISCCGESQVLSFTRDDY